MTSGEHCFTIHHWPALREWDVTPHEVNGYGACFADSDVTSLGLFGAINHCVREAAGHPAVIVIEAQNRRWELRVIGHQE
jgi:hypothetical protein